MSPRRRSRMPEVTGTDAEARATEAAEQFGNADVGAPLVSSDHARLEPIDDGVLSSSSHRKSRLEIRWFVRGELPVGRWSKASAGHRRTDWYHLPSLSEISSLKRRGGGSLERKQRLGVPILVECFGGTAWAERWVKYRSVEMPSQTSACSWIAVQKRVWQWSGVQLAAIMIDDETWWTIALNGCPGAFQKMPRRLRGLLDLAVHCRSQSYPLWLLRRSCDMKTSADPGWSL
jgi:hypothetical protein